MKPAEPTAGLSDRLRGLSWVMSSCMLAGLILAGMVAAAVLQFLLDHPAAATTVLLVAICCSSPPLIAELIRQLARGNFSVDTLAAASIVSALILRQYWVAAVVILMLSGGKALEDYATRRASSVLGALARRMPHIAHRMNPDGSIADIDAASIAIGDKLALHPHELCPVDGVVIAGNGTMDESYLTGEPFLLSKAPGAVVLSGSINGTSALTLQATRVVADSRYARIVAILKESEQNRPRMRRIGDRLGAWYTPAALAVALLSWLISGDSERFLAVIVIATPCPLLLSIPIAIIGAISVAAKRGIVIKDPAILEKIDSCDTLIIDKTGTLTYGKPSLNEVVTMRDWPRGIVLQLAASVEQYSKHPLASAVLQLAKQEQLPLSIPDHVLEIPGNGLTAHLDGHEMMLTGRTKLPPRLAGQLPEAAPGLECVVLIDGEIAAIFRFRDEPRPDSRPFLGHMKSRHDIRNIVLLSGDRRSEVAAFAQKMGITAVHGGKSPEEKVAIVRDLTKTHQTLYVGDGINDAPAMLNATTAVALGVNSDITSGAAGAVILHSSLAGIDELIHVGRNTRHIALTSAIGGLALSAIGMAAAAAGMLRPIEGAVLQEVIDLLSILYALRVILPTSSPGDFESSEPATSPTRSAAAGVVRHSLGA